ncbi:uncharacterized protein I303_105775 [Kwoniella dejecticola CBS 10117]|uniref:Uncharacterized protein n=1 Tax=Kwoniella dejecticola CBS 10117 TaxID=1296121 RepID=A0A1A6A0C0_9TREE|nr:uncharacterized protein I303_05797 [Kwoniella dejecticola CBS 10117]OBR83517.1 hypothetical protein I303_05797 [Kwoniella dejecticola CBS 10117]
MSHRNSSPDEHHKHSTFTQTSRPCPSLSRISRSEGKNHSRTPDIRTINTLAQYGQFNTKAFLNVLSKEQGYEYIEGDSDSPLVDNHRKHFELICSPLVNGKEKPQDQRCEHKLHFERSLRSKTLWIGPFELVLAKSDLQHNHEPDQSIVDGKLINLINHGDDYNSENPEAHTPDSSRVRVGSSSTTSAESGGEADLSRLEVENEALKLELEESRRSEEKTKRENEQLAKDNDQLRTRKPVQIRFVTHKNSKEGTPIVEKDQEQSKEDHERLKAEYERLGADFEKTRQDYEALRLEHAQLIKDFANLKKDHTDITGIYKQAEAKIRRLETQVPNLEVGMEEIKSLKTRYEALLKKHKETVQTVRERDEYARNEKRIKDEAALRLKQAEEEYEARKKATEENWERTRKAAVEMANEREQKKRRLDESYAQLLEVDDKGEGEDED